MSKTLIKMEWTSPLSKEDMIGVLHEQGELQTFDPANLYREVKQTQVEKPKKQQKLKKADQMKLDNIREKEEKQSKLEKEKIKYLIGVLSSRTEPVPIKEITEFLDTLNFESNKFEALLEYLNYHLSISNDKMVCDLFIVSSEQFQLNYKNHEGAKKLLKKVKEYIDKKDIDLVEHQMTISPQFMPPLSPFEKPVRKLEKWQLEVLDHIDNNRSVLIIAPTSSGKTACMNYIPSTVKGKCCYVVPSNELAKQVAGMYRRSLKGGVSLLTNKEKFFENDNWQVLVATPYALENYLVYNPVKFNYVVYDEIQKLNPDNYDYLHEGAAFERLMKMIKSPFMALTATIQDPDLFGKWLENVSGNKVEIVIHKIRPIIQQLHEYCDGKLKQISRYDSISDDLSFIKSEEFLQLPLTSSDLYKIYQQYEEDLEDDTDPHDHLFKRINLNDIENYRQMLLKKLQILPNLKLNSVTPTINTDYNGKNFIELLKQLKNKGILPAILFKLDEVEAVQIYEKIINTLQEEQDKLYPHHQDDLFWLNDQRKGLDEKIASVEKLKVPDNENDPVGWIQRQKQKIEAEGFNVIKGNYSKLIEDHIQKTSSSQEKKYYRKILNEFIEYDSFPTINPYAPHEEFVLHNHPLSENQGREIRRKLIDNLRAVSGMNVDFNKFSFKHMFLKGILRGVVLYTRSMPAPFQHVVQSLVATGKAPIIISDDSLAYGVNFPIKTTIICGSPGTTTLDVVKAHQMMGRSGRRGIDREGHVIFMGVDWKKILRAQYSPLIGDVSIGWYSRLPSTFLSNFDSDCIVKPQTLRECMLKVDDTELRNEAQTYSQLVNMDEEQGLWSLRWCDEIKNSGLGGLEHNFQHSDLNEVFTYLATLLKCNSLNEVIKSFIDSGINKEIVESGDTTVINEFKRIGDFLLSLYPYTKTKKVVETLFNKIKMIWEKHQL